MRLTDRLLSFALIGSEWVLWLLVMLSILSVAVMVERALTLSAALPDFEGLTTKLLARLAARDWKGARELIGAPKSPEARVGLLGLDELPRGRNATLEAMAGAKARERLRLERNLGILGTLGNNTPFIGLFGTVLGIMQAFHDLSKSQQSGGVNTGVVMSGISEALAATAFGLLVAIPAVIAFNALQGKVRRSLGRIDAMAHLILSATEDGAAPVSVAKD